MDVAVTGANGLIGAALTEHLRAHGHRVVPVTRSGPPPGGDGLRWDPAAGRIDAGGLEGLDGVVHLAGDPIGTGRWTAAKRRRILESRTDGTGLLARTLAGLTRPPGVLVSGSAVGFYGDRGDHVLTEDDERGTGFLADVVSAWEAAAAPAVDAGIRVVRSRSGIVLAAHGGVLKPQLPLFKLGLGGRLGRGDHYVAWITLADEVDTLTHLLTSDLSGPVNVVAPEPVTNAEFTATLARVLRRPAVLPVPAFALRLALGRGRTDELLLASQRVVPRRLEAEGHHFRHPHLEDALRAVLNRPAPTAA